MLSMTRSSQPIGVTIVSGIGLLVLSWRRPFNCHFHNRTALAMKTSQFVCLLLMLGTGCMPSEVYTAFVTAISYITLAYIVGVAVATTWPVFKHYQRVRAILPKPPMRAAKRAGLWEVITSSNYRGGDPLRV